MPIARCSLLLLVVAALAGGCSAGGAGAPSPASLDGTAWVLAALPGRALPGGEPATLAFDDGRVQGSDGCNRYASPYSASSSSITVSPRGMTTRMACPPDRTALADAFAGALAAAERYRVRAARLELLSGDGKVLAVFAAQSQALAGTSWRATGVNNGRQAVASVVASSEVTMDFGADGSVSGSAGCNRWSARYRSDGDALRIESAVATRMACQAEGVMEQEAAFLLAVEAVAIARIDGERLELRRADGALLVSLVRAPAAGATP